MSRISRVSAIHTSIRSSVQKQPSQTIVASQTLRFTYPITYPPSVSQTMSIPLMAQQLVTAEEASRAAVLAAGHEALVLPGVGLVDPGVPAEVRGVLEGAGAGGVRAGMSCWCDGRGAGDGASGLLDRGLDGGARGACGGVGWVGGGVGWASEADGWASGIGKNAGVDVG
ncbi:MAG: hypothetical protein FRX48_04268 [Lasallia pustulata]|uniref:Uncharacterized protein n=1 Tax=Lasallia pustulata TaxID=136370 RepID=A0A5M8PT24_9LECA|nr:MAG: hypothetical protein FRX48_04268 [Lasallia pustulata]